MTVNYTEYNDSQKPALTLLQKMGWQYLSPEVAFEARSEMYTNVLLDDILAKQLSKINAFEYKGESKITQLHPPGISLTASAYDGVVIVTEYGFADLRELTSGEKAMAIAGPAASRPEG